jgi:hypothetical protein
MCQCQLLSSPAWSSETACTNAETNWIRQSEPLTDRQWEHFGDDCYILPPRHGTSWTK